VARYRYDDGTSRDIDEDGRNPFSERDPDSHRFFEMSDKRQTFLHDESRIDRIVDVAIWPANMGNDGRHFVSRGPTNSSTSTFPDIQQRSENTGFRQNRSLQTMNGRI
jgi:hypothetical protein